MDLNWKHQIQRMTCNLKKKLENLNFSQTSPCHATDPWSSARRATARRRSPDQIFVAGVEKKMPSTGGSQWEALSLMHAAKQQAQTFIPSPVKPKI
eukprot:1161195-Pelagomonas_calceolata.AAC.1